MRIKITNYATTIKLYHAGYFNSMALRSVCPVDFLNKQIIYWSNYRFSVNAVHDALVPLLKELSWPYKTPHRGNAYERLYEKEVVMYVEKYHHLKSIPNKF